MPSHRSVGAERRSPRDLDSDRLRRRAALTYLITILLIGSVLAFLPSAQASHPWGSFTYTPSEPKPNETIQFTDTSTESGVPIVAWEWTFGDGNTSTEQNPTHAYTQEGTYQVRMTPTNDWGEPGSPATQSITVAYPLPQPSFTFTPATPTSGEQVNLTDTSTSPEYAIVNWTWDLGDGNTSYLQHPNHTFARGGDHTVTLTVTDTRGGSASLAQVLTTTNQPPLANFTFLPASPTVSQTITFTDASSDADGSLANWTWDLGDGNVTYGASANHSYPAAGTYTVNLTVTDGDGDSDHKVINVTVRPRPSGGGGGWSVPFGSLTHDGKGWTTGTGWTASGTLPSTVTTFSSSFPDDSPVRKVTLYTEGTGSIRIDIKNLPDQGLEVPGGLQVTDQFDIQVWTATGLDYTPGQLELNPNWMQQHGIDPRQFVTLHGADGSWEIMTTSVKDGSGLLYAHSPTFSPFAIAIDIEPPRIDAAGMEGPLSAGDAITILATDNRGIHHVTALLDGVPIALEMEGDEYTLIVPSGFPSGTYGLVVSAEDESGLLTTKEWSLQVSTASEPDDGPAVAEEQGRAKETGEASGVAGVLLVVSLVGIGYVLRRRG